MFYKYNVNNIINNGRQSHILMLHCLENHIWQKEEQHLVQNQSQFIHIRQRKD